MPSLNPEHVQVLSFGSPEALAQKAAGDWLQLLSAVRPKAPYTVALSGGRIAGHFFQAAASQAQSKRFTFQNVHFFWGDERCVPPGDPESNFRLANESLLAPLAVPQDQIHRLRGEIAPAEASTEGEAELRRLAPASAEGQPVLDLVFLGVGEEGHVASLFPGEPPALIVSPAVFRPVTTPKPPPRRITLGYPALAAAREVWVLASGPGKEGALRESLSRSGQTPLGRVLRLRPHTRIYTDLPLAGGGGAARGVA